MIGIFDSGFGGLQTLAYFQEQYPDYDYIFLADQAHYPFGTKTAEQIEQYTFQALERLFAQGAAIVIVACNTAAAFAIKKRQSTHPDKKALSITIPGMEKIQEIQCDCKHITVRATEGTMKSGMYSRLFNTMPEDSDASMDVIIATDLVDIVEKGIISHNTRKKTLAPYIQQLQQSKADCLVLGCTHFPALIPSIQEGFSGIIINPGYEAVRKFGIYLDKHPEIAKNIGKNGHMHLYTTGDADNFRNIGQHILARVEGVQHVQIIPEKYQ